VIRNKLNSNSQHLLDFLRIKECSMRVHRQVTIAGTGMYVPPDIHTNHDLEKLMDTSDEWIQQRSGIKERRYAKPGIGASDLGYEAAMRAIDMAGLKAHDIDMIIFATLSPDYYFPGSGVFLQERLGCGTIPALDIRNQCSGFLYALSCGQNFVASGQYKNILVVGAETHSRALNFSTAGRDVTVLFGDGAGAVVLSASKAEEHGIIDIVLHSEGAHKDALKLQSPSGRDMPMMTAEHLAEGHHYPKMDGRYVFKHAVTRLAEVTGEILGRNHLTPSDVDLFLFHQANLRINEAVLKSLDQPASKTYNNIDKYGNCSSASIPMLLDECVRAGRLAPGKLILMAAFGAGFTWGSALIRW
jgi:3-oxoacyl-[acyl-carrier-protein] synthase-3